MIAYDRILRTAHWPGAVVEGLACDEEMVHYVILRPVIALN
jgi:hypothetical protein